MAVGIGLSLYINFILIIQEWNWDQAKQSSCTLTFKGILPYQAEF